MTDGDRGQQSITKLIVTKPLPILSSLTHLTLIHITLSLTAYIVYPTLPIQTITYLTLPFFLFSSLPISAAQASYPPFPILFSLVYHPSYNTYFTCLTDFYILPTITFLTTYLSLAYPPVPYPHYIKLLWMLLILFVHLFQFK